MDQNSEQIGGPGKEVDIDESKFGKRIYHTGQIVEGIYDFGGFEMESKLCVCVFHRQLKTEVRRHLYLLKVYNVLKRANNIIINIEYFQHTFDFNRYNCRKNNSNFSRQFVLHNIL